MLRRIEAFLPSALPKALEVRQQRAARLLELDELVNEAVAGLREQGLTSPYLKTFVVARVNPLRFQRGRTASFDETMDKLLAAGRRFDPSKVQIGDLAGAAGPPAETADE